MRYRLPTIHRFPTVEYIPLNPKVLAEEAAWDKLNYGNFSLIIRDGNSRWGSVPDGLPNGIRDKLTPLGPDEAGLVSLNFTILEMMYRGNTVFVAAEKKPDYLGLYVITKRFFYKPEIIFEVYDLEEKKLAWSRLKV
ncbi:MAG: hypothetical protein H0Z38_00755 [Firmicutes bacterium]|nr:hypothetical protein [Bacillota bacterium]